MKRIARLLASLLAFFEPAVALATTSILCNGALVDYQSLIAYLNNPSFGGGGTFANLTVTGNAAIGSVKTNTLGFFGATPVSQAATMTLVGTAVATTGAYGFTTTQAAALLAGVNACITALAAFGLAGT